MIDWKKPVQTKCGLPVRILCTDAEGDYPVVGLIDGIPQQWDLHGNSEGCSGDWGLENTPPLEKFYVNINEDGVYRSSIQGLTFTPTTMAQMIVDPENKTIRVQAYNDVQVSGVLDKVVKRSDIAKTQQPQGGFMDNSYKTIQGHKSGVDLNKIEVVEGE